LKRWRPSWSQIFTAIIIAAVLGAGGWARWISVEVANLKNRDDRIASLESGHIRTTDTVASLKTEVAVLRFAVTGEIPTQPEPVERNNGD